MSANNVLHGVSVSRPQEPEKMREPDCKADHAGRINDTGEK